MSVPALKGTVKAYTNAFARLAKQNKKFAEMLVYDYGVRGEITPEALTQLTKDAYECTGKLTSVGREELKKIIKHCGLPKSATWDKILQKVIVDPCFALSYYMKR